jgi:AcrR family transcriptional regulator
MAARLSRIESQERTKEKLLAAAEEEFSVFGFRGAAMDRITEKAGFSRGAFYANYKSKEDFFLSLVETRMNAIISDLRKMNNEQRTLHKDALLKYYATRTFDKKLTLLMAEFLMTGIRNTKLRAKVSALNDQYIQEVAKAISLTRDKKTADTKDQDYQKASILLSAGQGLMLVHFGNTTKWSKKETEKAMSFLFERLLQI